MSFLHYCNNSAEEVISEFSSSKTIGLSNNQVFKQRKIYGLNALLTKEKTWFEFFISQYKSPIILLLLGAGLTSLFLHEYINAITILLIVFINTLIGFYQEYRATRSVKLLEKYLERKSKIIRNDKKILIKNKHIVPGDIVVLEPGDYIPADMRFIEAHHILVDESRFSGESLPISKTSKTLVRKAEDVFHADNIGFSGTTIVEGHGLGIVFATGQNTLFGKIGDLTISTVHDTRFFQNIKKISYFLVKMIGITLAMLIIAHIIFKSSTVSFAEILMFSVALAVGIAPEALPAISMFSLSRGALILARNNVIIKRLSSIEDLGGLEAIYTDKTGTITENILTVADIYTVTDEDPVFYMALSGSIPFKANKRPDSPFDYAAWDKLTTHDFSELSKYQRIEEVPFDAKHRRSLVVVQRDTTITLISRGAYEEVVKRSKVSDAHIHKIHSWVTEKANRGCRVIAIAKKQISLPINNIWKHETDMELIGLIALYDPIKESVKETVSQARQLGLEVKIITGDGPEIAGHIAYEIGLIKNKEDVITGEEFAILHEHEKERIAEVLFVFARFLPEQKSEIIQILKKRRSVAYLGDGINDAPALKAADVGLAVDTSSDIAKDSADIVLLKKNLKTIIDGIIIGRQIFVNTFNYLKITLASNVGNFYSIAIISLFVPFLPLLPLQILLVNLLSDAPMIAISTDNVSSKEITKPTNYNLKNLVYFIVIFGIISSLFDFIFFYNFYSHETRFFQTHWFIFSILTEILFIFSGRSKAFFTHAVKPSRWLLLSSILAIALTITIPYTSFGQTVFSFINPTYSGLIFMIGIAIAYFVSCEIFKLFYYFFLQADTQD